MESLDWTQLAGNVVKDTSRIPYERNKHLFRKVAFDVFQLNSSPVESLWKLEGADGDAQFLVAQYDEDNSETIEVKSHWAALADRSGKNVTLTYKKAPIQRFASADYGFSEEDVHVFQQTLVEKLGSDESFTSNLLKSQPKVKFDMLVSQFPELQRFAAQYPSDPFAMTPGQGYGAYDAVKPAIQYVDQALMVLNSGRGEGGNFGYDDFNEAIQLLEAAKAALATHDPARPGEDEFGNNVAPAHAGGDPLAPPPPDDSLFEFRSDSD